MRGRFLHAHRLAGRIEKAEFVERIVADAFPRDLDAQLFDDVRVLRDARLHVGEGGRRKLELVQADDTARRRSSRRTDAARCRWCRSG